jgi:hypothetical protein
VSYTRIPRTLRRYRLRRRTLEETRAFLLERGVNGLEAVVLWLGSIVDDDTAEISAAYVPEQIAYRTDEGVAVEVTQDGLTRLISALPPGVFVLVRIHSHPGEAYHSELDDMNMLISHEHAISVVVPNFAIEPIDLTACSVNELEHGRGWRPLVAAEVAERFEIL